MDTRERTWPEEMPCHPDALVVSGVDPGAPGGDEAARYLVEPATGRVVDVFAPELVRKLDAPAEYPGRRPYPWPESMSEAVRRYLGRHDGQWIRWEQDEEYNVFWGGEGRPAMAINPEGSVNLYGKATEDGCEIFCSPEGRHPELQAYFGVLARLQPGGPGMPTNVIYLTDRDSPGKVVSWACKSCRVVARTEAEADRCCRCHECEVPRIYGPKHSSCWCSDECRKKVAERRKQENARSWAEREKEYAAKRDKRPRVHWKDVKGPVSDDGDHYESELDLFAEWYLENLEDPEDFSLQPIASTCEVQPMQLDAVDALQRALEQAEVHEEAEWTDEQGFIAFVAEWNKRQSCQTWMPNNDLIDWTGYPWLDHCPADCESWAPLRAEIERQLANAASEDVGPDD